MAKEQILIADDDPLIARDLKDRLESLDYQVAATVARARDAVVLAQDLRPDLTLMDIRFPGEMDGIQAAEEIRTLQIPVVYVTGYCDGELLDRAKLTEPYGYILKPYETRDLKTSIEMGLFKHRAELERQRLLEELQDALAHVKALSGLLSICAYCKKIKEDEDDWSQLEAYIMKHTDASFTHGMCPDCFEQVRKQLAAVEANELPAGSLVLG
jgi:two-component system, response regulator PdtaR